MRSIRLFDGLLTAANVLGSLLIAGVALLVNADVFGRALFDHPIAGVPELAALLLVVIVFLQVPYCLRGGQLTRSDSLLLFLRRRSARSAAALDALHHVAGAMLFGVVSFATWQLTMKSYLGNEYAGVMGVATIPEWPMKAIVSFGSAALCLQFLRMALQRLRAARSEAAARHLDVSTGVEL